jgi:hypothetical protein
MLSGSSIQSPVRSYHAERAVQLGIRDGSESEESARMQRAYSVPLSSLSVLQMHQRLLVGSVLRNLEIVEREGHRNRQITAKKHYRSNQNQRSLPEEHQSA